MISISDMKIIAPNLLRLKIQMRGIRTEVDGLHIHVNMNAPHRTLHAHQSRRVCGFDGSVWACQDNFWCRRFHDFTRSFKLGMPNQEVRSEVRGAEAWPPVHFGKPTVSRQQIRQV